MFSLKRMTKLEALTVIPPKLVTAIQRPRIIVTIELTYLPVALVNEASVLVGWFLRILQTLQQHLHTYTLKR
jgi:hypothetical protein